MRKVAGVLVIVFGLTAACGRGELVDTTQQTSASPSVGAPVIESTSTAVPTLPPGDAETIPLRVQAAQPLPLDLTVYYRSAGYESTKFMPGLYRASGVVAERSVLDVFASLPGVHDWATDFERGLGFAVTCVQVPCTVPGSIPDAATLWTTNDAGISWAVVGAVPPASYLQGIVDDEALVRLDASVSEAGPSYSLLPSGRELAPPVVAGTMATPYGVPGVGLVWKSIDGDWYDAAGTLIWADAPVGNGQAWILGRRADGRLLAADHGNGRRILILDVDGEPVAIYEGNGLDFEPIRKVSDSVLLGTIVVFEPSERRAIAVFDLANGTITPIDRLPAEMSGAQHPIDQIVGEVLVVSTSGSCVNVHGQPASDSPKLGCYLNGVLLRTREADISAPEAWVAVLTPDGHAGWAAADRLKQ